VPLADVHNDARRNIVVSTMVAAQLDVPEVCLFMNDYLLRGCRSTKVDSVHFAAFESPNFPPLATLGVTLAVDAKRLLPQPRGRLRVQTEMDDRILCFRLVPGFSDSALEALVENHSSKLKAIVFELYGTGNAPNSRAGFLNVVKHATEKGVLVVITTQCLRGEVSLGMYAVGNALQDVGAVSGGDMTIEALTAKLGYLFGAGLSREQVKLQLHRSLRGELTVLQNGNPNSVVTLPNTLTKRPDFIVSIS